MAGKLRLRFLMRVSTSVALLVLASVPAMSAAQLPSPDILQQPQTQPGRNILITGYWPPTNEMLRPWSSNAAQNPGGWVGENWENRGFNVHAFFPEFPGGTTTNPRGTGDFEVDYQDTTADLAQRISQLNPIAIVSFSRANTNTGWELEPAYQRFRLPGEAQLPGRTIPTYTQDYFGNRYPTEALAGIPVGDVRVSNLPMQRIVNAVTAALPASQINAFIPAYNPATPDTFDYGGAFLSGFLPYLAARHRDSTLGNPLDPAACLISGHVHVGRFLNTAVGTEATKITLREVIRELQFQAIPTPATAGLLFAAAALNLRRRRR